MSDRPNSNLTLLGRDSTSPSDPDSAHLERISAPAQGATYLVRLTCPEFTSLCPVTGQPDFAHIVIDYVPSSWIVESKSFKFYLGSFRSHGVFHEACTLKISQRLYEFLSPRWLRIGAYWYPRGGIPIDVFWQTGTAPEGLWLPEQGVPPYKGRI